MATAWPMQGGTSVPVSGPNGSRLIDDAVLLVRARQAIDVLPIGQDLSSGDVLRVGDVVGDAAALEAGEAAGQRDLGQQPGVGRAVADLDGLGDAPRSRCGSRRRRG